MEKKKIVYKRIDEIKPYENNPRFNDEAVELVAKSIKEYGFQVPLVITKEGVIVTGHTRYKASLELGLDEIPCIIADDLTEEQIKAFRLVDNKVSEKASWNFELLDEELANLDIDLSEFGFEDLDISFDSPIKNTNAELDTEKYTDDKFECECPKCGFRFNVDR